MQRASGHHPLLDRMGEGWATTELDELLGRLEAAAPERLEGKVRDFRALTDLDRWSDLLSEFLIADWFISRGLDFDFGDRRTPNPDLVVPSLGIGFEVARRAREGPRALRRAIMAGTAGVHPRPRVQAHVSAQVLSIRRGVLDQITREVATAARSGQMQISAVLRPAHEHLPAVTVEIHLNRGVSVVPTITMLSGAFDPMITHHDIESVITSCLRDKRKSAQGAAMPALLLVDATDLAPAVWLRSPQAWSQRLARLMTAADTFAGVGLVATTLGVEPRSAIGLGRNEPGVQLRIHEWGERMGIPTR